MARDGQWEDYIWDKQPLLAASAQGTTYFLNDERMSNRGVFSSGGTMALSYDAFGVKEQTGEWPAQFAYTGFYPDPITGYYNAGWRQYDASAGRFISKDPVAGSLLIPMTLNPFIYCLSDPINHVDPTGMILAWLAGGIVGAVVNVGTKESLINSVYRFYKRRKAQYIVLFLKIRRLNQYSPNVTGKTLMKGLVSFGLVKTVDTMISKGIDTIKDGITDYAKGKVGDILSGLFNKGASSDVPTGLRELLTTNRAATCATA